MTSIAPYIAVRSAYEASKPNGKATLDDWKLIKSKLESLRKSLDETMSGLQTVLPSSQASTQEA